MLPQWLKLVQAMYIVHELVNGYETDPAIQNLLDSLDFYILPVMNPDGYEYSRTKVGNSNSRMQSSEPNVEEESSTGCL